jgi:pimeloyl-ACP methyl ester carboxylesterase
VEQRTWRETAGNDSGPMVVFTHGWGATAHMWRPQVEALGRAARVVTWDLRGHGRSPSPDDPAAYSLDIALADLDELVTEPAVLVGHSLGGVLSLTYALRNPSRVRALGLLSTGPGYRNPAGRAEWNAMLDRQAGALERDGLAKLPAGPDLHGGLHTSPQALAHAIRGFVAQHDSEVIDGLHRITQPALVLVGAKDKQFLAAADHMTAKLPNVTKVVVDDAGHAVNLHQPEAVNAALAELIRGVT